MIERTNQEWLDALSGSERDEALADRQACPVHSRGARDRGLRRCETHRRRVSC